MPDHGRLIPDYFEPVEFHLQLADLTVEKPPTDSRCAASGSGPRLPSNNVLAGNDRMGVVWQSSMDRAPTRRSFPAMPPHIGHFRTAHRRSRDGITAQSDHRHASCVPKPYRRRSSSGSSSIRSSRRKPTLRPAGDQFLLTEVDGVLEVEQGSHHPDHQARPTGGTDAGASNLQRRPEPITLFSFVSRPG